MEGKDEKLGLEPVNMYILFAKMFAHITREVEKACGEEGVKAVREGVRQFGLERGRDIARRAKLMGYPITPEFYLSCYDMERSGYFISECRITAEEIDQDLTQCIFADQWKKDGNEKYGIHYCQIIDPAIAEGYDPDFECIHDKQFFKDGCCHFLYRKKKA